MSSQGVEFKLEIKNLALSDSRGHDLQKHLAVRVTSGGSKQAGAALVFLCVVVWPEKLSPSSCSSGLDLVQSQVR